MYVYNVTVNVDDDIHDEWLAWMKTDHIPDVMGTGLFLSNKVLEVMVDEESGKTYSFQYEVRDLETLKLYHEVYAAKLQQDVKERYEGKFVAFRTILRLEHEHNKS